MTCDDLSAPTLDLAPGEGPLLDGRYRVGRLLARGGMGEVYEGVDVTLRRPVAVKFLGERFVSDAAVVERFRREAEALAALEHPAVVPVYAVGTATDGRPFFVMKRIFGRTIDQLIRAAGALNVSTTVHIALQILAGLERIHRAGFVHRDVKPANVMVDEAGKCTLLDFGILRAEESDLTATGFIVGTPEYMAPEQGRDARLASAASDLYSLGATIYAMLTGAPPFRGASSYEIVNKHHTESAAPPSARVRGLTRAVDRAVLRALAKEPAERFADAEEMRRAIRALAEPRWTGMPAIREAQGTATGDTAVGGEFMRGAATTIRTRRVRWLGAGSIGIAAALIAVVVAIDFGGDRRADDSMRRGTDSAETTVGASAAGVARSVDVDKPPRAIEAQHQPAAAMVPERLGERLSRLAAEARRATAVRRQESNGARRAGVGRRVMEQEPSRALGPRRDRAVNTDASRPSAPDARRVSTTDRANRASANSRSALSFLRVVVLDRGESTYAEVLVDGAPIGTAPIARHALSPGTHEIVAKRVGFRAARKSVDTTAGETQKIAITIEKLDP